MSADAISRGLQHVPRQCYDVLYEMPPMSAAPDPVAVEALWISGGVAFFALLQFIVGLRSANAAVRSAEASEESARAARMSQRPWVTPGGFPPSGIPLQEKMEVPVTVTNVGPSPAIDCISQSELKVFKKSSPDECPFAPLDEDEGRGILTAGTAFSTRLCQALTQQQIEGIRNGYLFLLLYGYAKYRDAWGDSHETRWCFKYTPETQGVSIAPRHNSAS